jgi:hypothetical protein
MLTGMDWVQAGKDWFTKQRGDPITTLMAYRDDHPLLAIAVPNNEVLPMMARLTAEIMAVDELVILSDTYHAFTENNPETGQQWRSGEMADYINRLGRESGVVTDAVLVQHVERFGEQQLICLPYDPGPPLVWETEHVFDNRTARMGGRLADLFTRDEGQPEVPADLPPQGRVELLKLALSALRCEGMWLEGG